MQKRKIHKIIVGIIWGVSTIITISNALERGWNGSVHAAIAMYLSSIIASIVYFLPLSDRMKGIMNVNCNQLCYVDSFHCGRR